MNAGKNKSINFFLVILLLTFISYALYTIVYGTMSTSMMDYYGIGTGQQGVFTTVCSIGGVAAALFCAFFGERFFKPNMVIPGLAILAAAVIIIIFAPPYAVVCVCSLLGGIGYTLIDIMGQSSITEYFPEKAKTFLPLIQIFFGVGSVAGPILLVLLINANDPSSFTNAFMFIGILTAAILIFYIPSLKKATANLPKIDMEKIKANAKQDPVGIFKSGKSWLILLSGTLFNCFSTSMNAWIPTFYFKERGLDLDASAFMLTLYLLGILIMRLFGPIIFRKAKPQKIFVIFTILSALCLAGSIFSTNITLCAILTFASGALTAFNQMCIIMISTAIFPERKASATSLAVFSFSTGGIIAPVIVGNMAEKTGFSLPFMLLGICLVASALVMAFVSAKCKKQLSENL